MGWGRGDGGGGGGGEAAGLGLSKKSSYGRIPALSKKSSYGRIPALSKKAVMDVSQRSAKSRTWTARTRWRLAGRLKTTRALSSPLF